jgi:ornithine cyclodeaminase/alanine dehydrogenase-like protein (mu-crystallin family)
VALFLRESEVTELLTMDMALEAVEETFRQQGLGQAPNHPRTRFVLRGGVFHLMPGALPEQGVFGFKAYTAYPGKGVRFKVTLYDGATGDILSIMEADRLGQVRTGAASGVATRYMARQDASVVGIFGTGWQARTQLEAVCKVRPVRLVKAYGRDPERRRRFAGEMEELLRVTVQPAETPEETVRGSDIVITITSAREPVFDGTWLEPGAHVNAAGSNYLIKREIDDTAVRRSAVIAVDDLAQAKLECGDLLYPIERGLVRWSQVHELGDIVAGFVPGRRSDEEITLFESQGIAIEDVAVARRVYELARARGMGQEIPIV